MRIDKQPRPVLVLVRAYSRVRPGTFHRGAHGLSEAVTALVAATAAVVGV